MRICIVTEKELNELVEKVELLTLQAEHHNNDSWAPMDQLRRSIHFHVVGWVREIKKDMP